MENSDARPVRRRVRCPRCNSVLEEPGAPVYQCGGCGTTLQAKNRTGSTGDAPRARGSPSTSTSGLPPQSRHLDSTDLLRADDATTTSRHQATDTTGRHESGDPVSARRHGSGDVASASSTQTATGSRRQGIDTASRRESGDLVSARRHGSGDVASTSSTPDATSSRRQGTDTTRNRVSEHVALIDEKRGHDQSAANREVADSSEGRSKTRDAGAAERIATPPPGGRDRDAPSELQDATEKRVKRQAEPTEAARKKHSGEAAAQPQYLHREEPAPKSAQAAAERSGREDHPAATATTVGKKMPSPSRHELQAQNLGPLREKILKTVDELKGDLSELFSKSPEELNPTPRARPPRLSKQEGSRFAAAADGHRGGVARVLNKPASQVAAPPPRPRGLPSRRYRQCRADPCYHNVQPRPCHHGYHGKPECSSCRGHCCRPRTQEPSAPRRKPPAAKEAKRRLPPRNHCRPVLKGAPFIVCSSCFKLVQVPADFAVATKTVRKLRCGSCSTVLSYSYRDPARKKDSIDEFSTDGSERHRGKGPFAPFVDDFGLSSYSTEDEQPLPVSRNTSFDTIDGAAKGVGRLHRLMGYGSASELLRRSPDLYESFSERTTPDVGLYDRKGKAVYIDDNDYDVDDSDEEDGGVLKRPAARGTGWPLPGMLGKGIPAPGAIRIK